MNWTSVNEAFPKYDEFVLGVIVEQFLGKTTFYVDLVVLEEKDEKYGLKNTFFTYHEDGIQKYEQCVTHWHPIPKMPTEEEILSVAKERFHVVEFSKPEIKQEGISLSDIQQRTGSSIPSDSPFYGKF